MVESEAKSVMDVECLLKNGHEVFVTIDLTRGDSIVSAAESVVYTRVPEPGVTEVTTIERPAIAFTKITTRPVAEVLESVGAAAAAGSGSQSSYRTLSGKDRATI